MKLALVAAALMISGTAFAQTTVAPGNANPEVDARGIPVVSDPADVPAGANQPLTVPPGAQVVLDPNQAQIFSSRPAAQDYPACSRTVTDNCVQAYERGVRR